MEVDVYIKDNDEQLGKFDDRAHEGIFLGYATNSKGYWCFNKMLHRLMDCIDVRVDEELPMKDWKTRSVELDDENTNDIEEQQLRKSKVDE